MSTILLEKYEIKRVLAPSQFIRYYVGEKRDSGATVLINEITDRKIINASLSDFVFLNQERVLNDFIEYFTDDSTLYVVFSYAPGQPVLKYLEKENLDMEYRIVLIQTILNEYLQYQYCPNIIQNSMIQARNIVIEKNDLHFNYCIVYEETEKQGIVQKNIFFSLGRLLEKVFSDSELKSKKKLSIAAEKCNLGIYSSIGELIKDMEDALGTLNKEITLKNRIQEKKEKFHKWTRKGLFAAVFLFAVFLIYQRYLQITETAFLYQDIEQIGSVQVKDNLDTMEMEDMVVKVKQEENIRIEVPVSPSVEEKERKEPEIKEYIVKKNDTLRLICREQYQNEDYAEALAQFNHLENKNLIYPGNIIKIPPKEELERFFLPN